MVERLRAWLAYAWESAVAYFGREWPTFWVAMVPMLGLAALVFTRSVSSNYIFDEQEALLANPYVNGKSPRFIDAIHKDFWGLPPDRSVGSYRPFPNFVWRAVWTFQRFVSGQIGRLRHDSSPVVMQPWVFHWLNVLLHAANGAILVCFVFALTKRRGLAWLAGATFITSAVITEAVCGVVGIADVMGGLGAMLALLAIRLPMWGMPFAVMGGVLFGLFSKESALVCVPLIPFAALVLAPLTHPDQPRRWTRALLALVASVGAFVLYVELRRRWFPSPLAPDLSQALPAHATRLQRIARGFLVWFHQAPLPKDPLNNPLVEADFPHRLAGALRVFWRGLVQVVLPYRLAGDYSFPQEPIPVKLLTSATVAGAVATVGLPLAGVVLWVRAWLLERRVRRQAQRFSGYDGVSVSAAVLMRAPHIASKLLVSVGLVWIVVSYFPHSNIPVLLPTVRAERFWYFPVIGSSLALACLFDWLWRQASTARWKPIALGVIVAFMVYQASRARLHAFDYQDDLVFWDATRRAVPYSAKAHLNYSVMWGARGRLDIRLESNRVAAFLAPRWPMAHIYLGDTLCRMHRPDEAWPHYLRGFGMAPGDPNLIALALQCLWDERRLEAHRDELIEQANRHPGSWLAYLAHDT